MLGTLVLVAAAVAAAWLSWSKHAGNPAMPSKEAIARFDAQVKGWEGVTMLALSDTQSESTQVATIAASLERSVEAESVSVPLEARAALLSTVARQAHARSSADVAHYMKTVKAECGRWLGTNDTNARHVADYFLSNALKVGIDEVKPEEALRLVGDHCLREQRGWFKAVGSGSGGARVRLFSVRSEPEFHVKVSSLTHDEIKYWHGSGHSAIRLRMPRRPLTEVIAEHGKVLCADVMILVENAAGHRYNWNSQWYWDPKDNCWACYGMSRSGGKYAFLMFY